MPRLLAAWMAGALAGCGTHLVVQEDDRGVAEPAGLVVNVQAVYAVKGLLVVGGDAHAGGEARLVGVRHDKVLVLNLARDMFASSKLSLKLDEKETIREVSITGKPGTADAVKTFQTVVEKRKEIVEKEDK